MARPGEPMTSERRLAAADRQRLALQLRKGGLDYRRIADQLGYDGPSGAFKAVTSALQKTLKEPAEDVRTLELARLDDLLTGLWPEVLPRRDPATGDTIPANLAAIDRVVRVMERRAKLLGLDAPLRIDVTALVRQTVVRFNLSQDEARVLQDRFTAFLAGEPLALPEGHPEGHEA